MAHSLVNEAIANARLRLNQKKDQIDGNPCVSMIRVAIAIDSRTHKVRACFVIIEEEFEPAAQGVVVDEALRPA